MPCINTRSNFFLLEFMKLLIYVLLTPENRYNSFVVLELTLEITFFLISLKMPPEIKNKNCSIDIKTKKWVTWN